MEDMIGIIKLFAGNFAPRYWAFCHGQLMSIEQNSALYSILGTTYGGDGRTSFALPDLRGRVPVGAGSGPGLADYRLGIWGGMEQVTLNKTQLPAHQHRTTAHLQTGPDSALTNISDGHLLAHEARGGGTALDIYTGAVANSIMSPEAIAVTTEDVGNNQPHENRPPFLALNYIICLYGVYPARS